MGENHEKIINHNKKNTKITLLYFIIRITYAILLVFYQEPLLVLFIILFPYLSLTFPLLFIFYTNKFIPSYMLLKNIINY